MKKCYVLAMAVVLVMMSFGIACAKPAYHIGVVNRYSFSGRRQLPGRREDCGAIWRCLQGWYGKTCNCAR